MNYYIIPAALLVTVLLMILFSFFLKRPMKGLGVFFIIVFLATWTGQLWIVPFGPVQWGIAWIPLFITALFFSLLFFAISPPVASKNPDVTEEAPLIALGLFFWIIVILLIVAIVIGYYRIPDLIAQ
ncbi:MAG: hypothetical protein ACJ76F_07620 [Bacteroidia bacterium]